jgi:hypothetical protein
MKIKPCLTGINFHINIFDSSCARVFFPEKTQEKKVIGGIKYTKSTIRNQSITQKYFSSLLDPKW